MLRMRAEVAAVKATIPDPYPATAPVGIRYAAYAGAECIDEDASLAAFLSRLIDTFGRSGEDLVVWQFDDADENDPPPTVVCVIRLAESGHRVTWIN